MKRWIAAIAWIVLVGVTIVTVAGAAWWIVTASTVTIMAERATVGAFLIAAVALSLPAFAGIRRWAQAMGPVSLQAPQQAAEKSADAALIRWEEEALLRGITGSGQLPVAWRWAGPEVAVQAGQMNPPHGGPTSGVVADLVSFYRGLDSNWNRLVIIGGPGSGKTAAMTLLLLSILRERQEGEPVPVWITLGAWNPNTQPLRDYAATIIGREFPATRAPSAGGKAGPIALLDARQVALFLDGLDEMPVGLQAEAARLIHQERTLPIVMTSRVDEYASATSQVPFDGAVIELIPLRMEQTIAALKIGHKADRAVIWERFTDRLVHWPTESRLWSSPLIVSLLRQAYETTGDPCELLGGDRAIPTDGAVQAALIERILHQSYPDPKQRDHALYWLTWFAQKLDGTRDIRWWDIPRWTPHLGSVQRFGFRIVCGLVSGAIASVIPFGGALDHVFEHVLGPISGFALKFAFGFLAGWVFGIIMGLATFYEPRSLMLRRPSRAEFLRFLAEGFGLGIPLGLAFGIMYQFEVFGFANWLEGGFKVGLMVGFGSGFGGGLALGLIEYIEAMQEDLVQPIAGVAAATPIVVYHSDARFGLLSGLGHGLLAGSVGGVGGGLTFGVAVGLIVGLTLWPWRQPSWLMHFSGIALGIKARRRFRPMRVLETARERQILRQVGSVYQFRHAELQDHLVFQSRHHRLV